MLESIFLVMFLVGLLFTVLSAVFSGAFHHGFGEGSAFEGGHPAAMGGDVHAPVGEGHAEVGWVQHDLATFSPLSPTVISAFITAAGGMGFLATHSFGWGEWASGAAAIVGGILFAALVFGMFTAIFRVSQGTTMVAMHALVGSTAEVVTPIPSGGAGGIAYVRMGQRLTAPARCADAAPVPRGSSVVIKSVTQSVFVVEETRESWLARTKAPAGGTRPQGS